MFTNTRSTWFIHLLNERYSVWMILALKRFGFSSHATHVLSVSRKVGKLHHLVAKLAKYLYEFLEGADSFQMVEGNQDLRGVKKSEYHDEHKLVFLKSFHTVTTYFRSIHTPRVTPRLTAEPRIKVIWLCYISIFNFNILFLCYSSSPFCSINSSNWCYCICDVLK